MIFLGRNLVDPRIQSMALAILDFEGWSRGSRSERNNNPGNLKFHGQKGAIGQDETGHAIFDSFESGWNSLIRQLQIAFDGSSKVYKKHDSLFAFFQKYCQKSCGEYAAFVAERLGVTPDTTLEEIIKS